jgi:hypothetical protein
VGEIGSEGVEELGRDGEVIDRGEEFWRERVFLGEIGVRFSSQFVLK